MGKIKDIVVLDVESFYDREEVTLRKLSTPEYIFHPKFHVTLLAAYDIKWAAPQIIDAHEVADFLASYDPATTMSISHNALFDNSVFAWRYGWVPARMVDTLGLARALRTYKRYSLGAVAKELFGVDSKGDVIGKVAGLDAQGIKNAGLWPSYREYAMQDSRICMQIFLKLWPEFPPEERLVMDLVLRAAVQPVLCANVPLLETHLEELRRKKARLLNDCGFDKAALMSTIQFQATLESLGVEIKTKVSPAGREVPQFAKTDPFMEELLEYSGSENDDINYQVQTLAAARLSFKDTIEETRAERFVNIAKLPWNGCGWPDCDGGPVIGYCRSKCLESSSLLPVALRYGAAHTHRLGGEWKLNMQNLPRDKTKSKLRAALCAPPGCKLITADLSQIEARIVAVLAHQDGLVEAFRNGEDVYAQFASTVFHRPINKRDNPNERFIGKVGILSLGYGAGATRFNQMVTQQAKQYGIPLQGLFDMGVAETTVNLYRQLFDRIPATWRRLDQFLQMNINGGNESPALWGPVKFSAGKITLPNAMTLRYEPNDQHLYGAKLLENISQALARIVIMQAAVRLSKLGYRMILQAHDELVFVVSDADVEPAKKTIMEEMIRPPLWLPELPLAAEIGVGDNYSSCK